MLAAGPALPLLGAGPGPNLLRNGGFEDPVDSLGIPPHWIASPGSEGTLRVTAQAAHGGRQALARPAHGAVEQKVASVKAGAYLARGWIQSEADQSVALLVQDTSQPWVGYSYTEIKVPGKQWVKVEAFCSLEKDGSLTLTLGELSRDFRFYHGVNGVMPSPVVVDDLELIRYEPSSGSGAVTVTTSTAGTSVIRGPRLAGMVRTNDGSLEVAAVQDSGLKPRCLLVPSLPLPGAVCSLVTTNGRQGIRVSSAGGDHSYVAWFTPEGLVTVVADHIPQFRVTDCHLRYALLPSFAGTDLCYAPRELPDASVFNLPSTQWLVGLVDGNESLLVTVWESGAQPVSLGLEGKGDNRMINSLTIGTEKEGFHLSLVEHPNLWHREALKEDWLSDYTPIAWQRPFPARWMSRFFVTPATKPTFRQPNMGYAFPIADAKTRQWGVWFEDWNNYPFYFDGPQTIFHFDKTFVPTGEALIYFLEPAAADLSSPCEIVEQALGRERALALFDFDANRLRQLSYSTPDEFMYDRPVCATTTRLTQIKQADKATLGVNLATHLYEFIREIRNRVDQYNAFFARTQEYLESEQKAHPELKDYLEPMAAGVAEAQGRSKGIYATPLASVQTKTDAIKKRLLEVEGDGFSFGNLDCRNTAGSQDDLCRFYNRFVLRLTQTAALNCGDSPQKAQIARRIWDDSRLILRQPTRWESRRTLYFFEP